MKILIICSCTRGKVSPFIHEQVDALRELKMNLSYFLIKNKGITGYFKSLFELYRRIRNEEFNIIHAHYGLSGLIAVCQRKIPVIITFHGSDVNNKKIRLFSKIASRFSAFNILVEGGFSQKLKLDKNHAIIPCGINLNIFKEKNYAQVRTSLGINSDEKIILFSSFFNNPVKNFALAKKSVELSKHKIRLVELKQFTREEVSDWMNASDLLLLTSFSEGSPQVVKEAIACRLPVFSTPVGDVVKLSEYTDGITIIPYDAEKIAEEIDLFFLRKSRIQHNEIVEKYDNRIIAKQIKDLYQRILKKDNENTN